MKFRVLPRYNALLGEELELPGHCGRAVHERFHGGKAAAQRLGRMVAKHPEVVVKLHAKIYTPGQAKAAVDYITRDGQIDALNEAASELRGLEEVREALETWRLKDDPALPRYDSMANRNARLAIHMSLSMPVGVDAEKVLEAGRRFCLEEFGSDSRPGANRPYLLVLHTPETEPDKVRHESKHPHVHVVVKARNDRGERLRTEPEDLERFREVFAWHLRAQDVQANATSRLERGEFSRGLRVHHHAPGRRQNTMAAHALEKNPKQCRVLALREEQARRGDLDEPTEAERHEKARHAAGREELRTALAIVTQGSAEAWREAQQFLAAMKPLQTDRERLVEQLQQKQIR